MDPGERVMRDMVDAAERGMERVALDLLGRSLELVPKETGHLAETGHLEPSTGVDRKLGGRLLEVAVVYATPYAAAQHEGHAMHPGGVEWVARHWTAPGTGPKYLESPLKEMASRYERALGTIMHSDMRFS